MFPRLLPDRSSDDGCALENGRVARDRESNTPRNNQNMNNDRRRKRWSA